YNKTDSNFVNNNLLSNDFYFTQAVFTLRTGFIILLPNNFKLIGGLQAENTATSFEFMKGLANNTHNSYWTLLPNISLRKQFNRKMN
ncbi:outer membrane beta-barrel protein, partial [Acinetobacter baumannii]